MTVFKSTEGQDIPFGAGVEQLKVEYILQRYRSGWVVIPTYPYLAIDWGHVQELLPTVKSFVVFSGAQVWQNMRREDVGARLIGVFAGGGTNAGIGTNSGAFAKGKVNAKAWFLMNWNPLLHIGTSPWAAQGTHFIAVADDGLYQHEFGDLIVVNKRSRPSSSRVDMTEVCDLLEEYNQKYLDNQSASRAELDYLSELMDRIFAANAVVLGAAQAHHDSIASEMTSVDYEAPKLTKYDRLTHSATGAPMVEIAYALLHYETAIKNFDGLKKSVAAGNIDDSLAFGVNCVVSAAACVEAVANRLVYEATHVHPDYRDRRTPLSKINDSGPSLAAREGTQFNPLTSGPIHGALEELRMLRNAFMHAKESETDIDQVTSTSEMLVKVGEANCRRFLASVRQCADHVFSQLSMMGSPIVTKRNVIWMGDLEVP
ncbi:hypothetical protein J4H89_23575 (plasmid) [Ralstonia solanacearum]|nr:hypothetical protein J4H89_23575 [Ralstonia solanacearum]